MFGLVDLLWFGRFDDQDKLKMKKKYNKIKNNTSITSSLKNNIKNYLKITSTDKLHSDITSSENIGKNIHNEDHSEYIQTHVPEEYRAT